MKSHFTWSPRVGAGLLALSFAYAAGGCSFLYDLGTTQCEIDDDCAALGEDFANTVCSADRVCVEIAGSGGSGGNDAGSSGKAGRGGSGGGGASEGGIAGTAAAMGGEGGAPPEPPECTTNRDCIEDNLELPYVCKDEKCVKLVTDECPLLLPTDSNIQLLKSGTPLILGGFANLTNADDPRDTPAAINWDLVYTELNDATLGGIPTDDGTTQPLLGLICNGSYPADDDTTLPTAITHLVSELGVPGMLTTMSSDRLKAAWDLTQEVVEEKNRTVLFISSVAADLALANLKDDGLMWHFLGDPRTTASTLASLARRIEPTIQANRHPNDTGPLRVTLIYNSNPTNVDIHTVLTTADEERPYAALSFNGEPATHEDNETYFRTVSIPAYNASTPADVSEAVADLKAHPPHLIVGLVGREFPSVMTQIEAWWGGSATTEQSRPYWLLSSSSYNVPELATAVVQYQSKTPPLSTRVLGVNYAEARDGKSKQLYTEYSSRLSNFYGSKGMVSLGGTENHYDAAYALLYAVAGANKLDPDGDALLGGLGRVLSKGSTSVDIGPSKVSTAVSLLTGSRNYKMALYGTMGPPDFDSVSGTRNNTPTSAWCVKSDGTFQPDGLIYEQTVGTFTDGPTVPTCLEDY